MPRRRPQSAKQKKLQLQDKRAVKRGDITPAELQAAFSSTNKLSNPKARFRNSEPSASNAKRLESRFVTVSPEYLEVTRNLAHLDPLARPIPKENALFPIELLERDAEKRLTCPARPKFRYDMTKKEVEKNEEGCFKKWMKATEEIMTDWIDGTDEEGEKAEFGRDGEAPELPVRWPRSVSWFETNLEVWRQLWRVTEASSIILLLLDSRCPPLHCPPSLRTYIQNLKPRKEVILVLTKSDLVDPDALAGWRSWLPQWWGDEQVQIVAARSYDVEALQGAKSRHRPDIPRDSLLELVQALRTAHERLSTPHARVRDEPEKLKNWKSPVRSEVDWSVLVPKGSQAVLARETKPERVPTPDERDIDEEGEGEREEPLTIGLVGQPNVGKSSLLNALLGEQRVRASKTPGKTKHFQTMLWGWKKEVKIVDCPGLVCPSLVGLEIQALTGILPIAQIPSMPACIHYASTLIPLEQVYAIVRSDQEEEDPYASKKTWRGDRPAAKDTTEVWTAGVIMEGRALERGYLTAKGGRPDGNRAANGMMRSLADGRIRWGFFPPDSNVDRTGQGIWLGGGDLDKDDGDQTPDEDDGAQSDRDGDEATLTEEHSGEDGDEASEQSDASDDGGPIHQAPGGAGGFFAALNIDDGASDDDASETDEDEEEGTSA